MKTLYLDIFSGISGDMFIGALLDLGIDARKLESELAKLNLDGYHLHIGRGQKAASTARVTAGQGLPWIMLTSGNGDSYHQ